MGTLTHFNSAVNLNSFLYYNKLISQTFFNMYGITSFFKQAETKVTMNRICCHLSSFLSRQHPV